MRKLKKVFKIDGVKYTLKDYSQEEVCKYLYEQLGSVAGKMTVYEFKLLVYMMNNGFTPNLSYYGRPTGEMYPQDMWYSYIGMSEDGEKGDIVDIKVCCKVNYDKYGTREEQVVVYEGGDRMIKIGTFRCIDDVIRVFRLNDYIPAKAHISQRTIDEVKSMLSRYEKWLKASCDEDLEGSACPDNFIMYGVGKKPDMSYQTDFSRLEEYNEF